MRPMLSICWQSPHHRNENSWCPTAGKCWRECEIIEQHCCLDNHQKEGKGRWNYSINFVADWTGYDKRFEIIYGVLMQCHWVNSSWCSEGLQHFSWTAWCWRWRHCDLWKFSELVTHWHIVALQKARIWTEYIAHLHTDDSNCFGICYSRTDESIRDVIVWFYHRTAVCCLVILDSFIW